MNTITINKNQFEEIVDRLVLEDAAEIESEENAKLAKKSFLDKVLGKLKIGG